MTSGCAVVNGDPCSTTGRLAKGYCLKHYARWRKWGDPLFDARDPAARFWAKVSKTDTCWIWNGARGDHGYGTFNAGSNGFISSHRWSYQQLVGPIPDGFHLDHLCKVRECCNPDHLEAVPPIENLRRATRIGHGHPNAPTQCHRGHDWTANPPYLAHRSDGSVTRRCRVCQIARTPKNPRTLAPCGTPAAAHRHYMRGEPVDDACRQAQREANRRHRQAHAWKTTHPAEAEAAGYATPGWAYRRGLAS